MKRSLAIGLAASAVALTHSAAIAEAPPEAPSIENGSFESPGVAARSGATALPDGWQLFTSSSDPVDAGVTAAEASDGDQSLVLKSTSTTGAFYGLLQVVEVKPGRPFKLEADVRNDPANPLSGTVSGQLSFEWLHGEQEVGRSYSGDWKQDLRADEWTPVTLAATAPATADRVRAVVTLREGDAPTGGAFLIDHLRLSTPAE